jgi:hypothetical protein
VGSNVVATGSGTIDLTGLTPYTSGTETAFVAPDSGTIYTGPASVVSVDFYLGFRGPTSFGSGVLVVAASSGSGGLAGIGGGDGLLGVPGGYVSGGSLSDTSTYDNQTLSSLGVTPGTYEWTWGSGVNQNFTLDIVAAAVPEPSSLLLLAPPLGFVPLLAARHRRTARNA